MLATQIVLRKIIHIISVSLLIGLIQVPLYFLNDNLLLFPMLGLIILIVGCSIGIWFERGIWVGYPVSLVLQIIVIHVVVPSDPQNGIGYFIIMIVVFIMFVISIATYGVRLIKQRIE